VTPITGTTGRAAVKEPVTIQPGVKEDV